MFMDLIANRRSIRRFKADKVETEKIELLKEAALRAPSSRGVIPGSLYLLPIAICWKNSPGPNPMDRLF